MRDLSQLLTAHPFPTALDRIRRSFARQPDRQTCGASAIRHGLLLGGLTIPTATLEAVLNIREHQGTSPATLRACLDRLGLEVRPVRRSARQSTHAFLDGLRPAFEQGAFLIPCILNGEHWVCIGAWQDGRVGMVDSFFHSNRGPYADLSGGLGFFSLSGEELDELDWDHHITLVLPGLWRCQYEAWLLARPALLRLNVHPDRDSGPTLLQAIRTGAHQYLDDAEYNYERLDLHLSHGQSVGVRASDPGGDAVGLETVGQGPAEVLVVRRLGGLIEGRGAVPEVVLRAGAVRAGQLANG
jgi:hypothetical protein